MLKTKLTSKEAFESSEIENKILELAEKNTE